MKMKMTIAKTLVSAAVVSALTWSVQAEVLVVVHPSYGTGGATNSDVSKVFLGKSSGLSGGTLIPVDQNEGSATRGEFYKKVTNKDPAQLNAYWSKLIFTGQGQPPKVVGGDDAVIDLVSKNPNMIGYVSGAAGTGKVKVVAKVP